MNINEDDHGALTGKTDDGTVWARTRLKLGFEHEVVRAGCVVNRYTWFGRAYHKHLGTEEVWDDCVSTIPCMERSFINT